MQVATVTANVALTTANAEVAEIANINGPGALLVELPNVTGLAAAASVTLVAQNLSGTQLASAVATNSGAGASAVGPVSMIVPIPQGYGGAVQILAAVSSGTGTAAASATSPITVVALP